MSNLLSLGTFTQVALASPPQVFPHVYCEFSPIFTFLCVTVVISYLFSAKEMYMSLPAHVTCYLVSTHNYLPHVQIFIWICFWFCQTQAEYTQPNYLQKVKRQCCLLGGSHPAGTPSTPPPSQPRCLLPCPCPGNSGIGFCNPSALKVTFDHLLKGIRLDLPSCVRSICCHHIPGPPEGGWGHYLPEGEGGWGHHLQEQQHGGRGNKVCCINWE